MNDSTILSTTRNANYITVIVSILITIAMISTGLITPVSAYATGQESEQPTESQAQRAGTNYAVKPTSPSSIPVDDITIHDMFTGKGAYVSKLGVSKVVSGTAPFDKNNDRGNDESDENDIIRSYDTAVYNVDYTMTSDPNANGLVMDYYRGATVGFEFLIPADENTSGYKLSFDTDSMLWMESQGDLKPVESTVTLNGKQYRSLVCYRTLKAETGSFTIPGTSQVMLAVKVGGAEHGYEFAPIVKSWLQAAPNRDRQATTTAPTLTVSAKLNINLRIALNNSNEDYTFDFNTGSRDSHSGNEPPNKGNRVVRGRLITVYTALDLRWNDRNKGMRGIEVPTGPIKYNLKLSGVVADVQNLNAEETPESWYQPQYWEDWNFYGRRPIANDDTAWLANGKVVRDSGEQYVRRVKKTEKINTTNNNSTVSFEVKDYCTKSYPKDTTHRDGRGWSNQFYSNDGTQLQVGEIQAEVLAVAIPMETGNGVRLTDYYKKNLTYKFRAELNSLEATSVSGDKIKVVNDNSNQSVTTDDVASSNFNVSLPGTIEQHVKYSCGTEGIRTGDGNWTNACDATYEQNVNSMGGRGEYSPNGLGGSWSGDGGTHQRGSDQAQAGSNVDVTAGVSYSLADTRDRWPAVQMTLVKFDPKVLGFRDSEQSPNDPLMSKYPGNMTWNNKPSGIATDGIRWEDWKAARHAAQWYWGVKKDGTDWTTVAESKTAGYDQLDFYPTYTEAAKHGVVLAATYGLNMTQANNSSTAAQTRTSFLRLKVRDDAKPGSIAVITANSFVYTRQDVSQLLDVNPDDSDEKWTTALAKLGKNDAQSLLTNLYGKATPSWQRLGNTYQEARFSNEGVYEGGDTAGTVYGDTMRVSNETVSVSKAVAQQSGGTAKKIYDIDRNERYADWKLTTRVETVKGTGATEIYLRDVLPKGLEYVNGSAHLNGTYKENTPNAGTVTGGHALEPDSIKKLNDGTTEINWTVRNVSYGTDYTIAYSTKIGDTTNPDNDVKNAQQFINKIYAQSKGDKRPLTGVNRNYSTATILVSKMNDSAIFTKANQLVVEVNDPIRFSSEYYNTGKNLKTNAFTMHVMPSTDMGSVYSGSYDLTEVTLSSANGANVTGAKLYFTDDKSVRTMEPEQLTLAKIQGWNEVPFTMKNGVLTATVPSEYAHATAYGVVVPRLEPKQSYTTTVSLLPHEAASGDSYIARWYDNHNYVDAMSVVVNRAINGYVWFDRNQDGVRNNDEPLLEGSRITMVNDKGVTVNSIDGAQLVTTADRNGYWSLEHLPALGANNYVKIEPKVNGAWDKLDVTVKNAQGASDATNSKADKPSGVLKAAYVPVNAFPLVSQMTTPRYLQLNRNAGITGTLTGTAQLESRKNLTGRDFLNGDKFTAIITPVGNAPASALSSVIEYTNKNNVITEIDLSVFPEPGDYTYTITEERGTAGGMTYDENEHTITILVRDNYDTMTRTGEVRVNGETNTVLTFNNTYKAAPVTVNLNAKKVLNGRELGDNEFSFIVTDKTGKTVATAKNTRNGTVSFTPITYSVKDNGDSPVGVYDYLMTEVRGIETGMTYDSTSHEVQVTVTDDYQGELHAKVTYNGGTTIPVFTNTWRIMGSLPVTGFTGVLLLGIGLVIITGFSLGGSFLMGTKRGSTRSNK